MIWREPSMMWRDPAIDLIRVVAMAGVVIGHWFVTALVVVPGRGLAVHSPLQYLDWLTPASWVFQTLALFFFAGGFAAARGRSRPDGEWLSSRVVGFVRAIIPLAAFWLVALAGLALLGVPNRTLTLAAGLAFGPLWFLLVYVALLAAVPLIRYFEERAGWWAILGPLLVVVSCDVIRHGPIDVAPAIEQLTWFSVLAGWLVPFQLGHALANRRFDHRVLGPVFLIAGLVGAIALVWFAGYPASMVGVTGAKRSNLNPVALPAVMLGLIQIGGFCMLRERIERVAVRLARVIPRVNALAMLVYVWHQSALVLVVLTFGASGLADGLTGVPADRTWLLHRLLWLPVFAAVLTLLCAVFVRMRAPSTRVTLTRWASSPIDRAMRPTRSTGRDRS